jgi:cobalt-zinc-cadmium efflux system outer membrane protein
VKLFLFVCFAVATASLSAQSESGSLRLDQVLAEARERNPRLRALRAAAEAADHREPEASTLPDPMLQLGVMNFGVPELNTDMAMSMAPAVQLMQMVPFPGKLSLRGEIAGYGSDIARSTAEEGWWEVRAQTATLFYELYALDRRLEVMRETLALLEDFQDVAKTMYSAGTGRQADVLRADVEVARMDGDIRQMVARRAAAAARLNAVLDRPASSHVPSPLLDPLPVEVPTAGELSTLAQESRPRLAHARLGLEQARSGSKLAAKEIWPDFAFGISYGQRNRGMGTERMASAMIGFSLPVHAGSRQHARRDEAIAMERLAEAQLRGWEAEIDARIGEMTAELERSRSLAVLYRDEVIPEARATVESAFSSYRVGTVDFMTLVDAQMTVNRYEGELFTLLADYGKAIAALESAVGRALPRTGNSVTEER